MLALPPLIRLSQQSKILALPDARKLHAAPMPQIGGVAIFAGFIIPALLFLNSSPEFWVYLVGAVAVLSMGLYDDRHDLDYRVKFAFQAGSALFVVVLSDMNIRLNLEETTLLPFIGGFFAFAVLIGVTNAINLSDGLDGLAGGLVLISGIAVAIISFRAEEYLPYALMLPLIGGLYGFLRFNAHPARVFMGDCGAYFIGFTLAFAFLQLCTAEESMSLIALIMVLGVPVYDTLSVFVRRLLRGQHPFSPDRTHFHHRLLALGFTHDQAVKITYVVHTGLVAGGFAMSETSDALSILVYIAALGLIESLLFGMAQHSAVPFVKRIDVGNFLPKFDRTKLLAYPMLAFTVLSMGWRMDPGIDFAIVGSLFAFALVLQWYVRTRRAVTEPGWSWLERAALFVLGAYSVYLLGDENTGELLAIMEVSFFGLLALLVILKAVRSNADGFQLTGLDVLVLIVTTVLSSLGEWRLESHGIDLVYLLVWFYAVEAFVVSLNPSSTIRGLILAAYLLIPLRYLVAA